MPEISRFLGIIVRMYYRDHDPPHFHASYGDYEVKVFIESGVVEGRFPARALRLVLEWRDLQKDGLLADWELARQSRPLDPVPPLE